MFLAHCDTKDVSEKEIKAIESPDWTPTWHPVSHGDVIDTLEQSVKEIGLEVVHKQYSVNKKGSRMFGAWEMSVGNGQMSYMLGIRNATDKTMGLGITGGTKVFVCDNLAFSGDYVRFRKHTGGLDHEELREMAGAACEGAVTEMERMFLWHQGLQQIYVPPADLKVLSYDAMERGVVAPSKFSKLRDAFEEERKIRHGSSLDCATSLYTFHGACTRVLRGMSLFEQADRNAELEKLCNNYIDSRQKLAA